MAKKEKKSALEQIKGVEQKHRVNPKLSKRIPKRKAVSISEYVTKILQGDRVFLSKAITLIESTHPKHFEKGQAIIKQCLPHTGNSIRIGVTGVPGVGKSTFIEQFGKYYTQKGHKVAVLAVDPSSSISKGSILGDKTRMETLSRDPNAFIRPSPSGNNLGGVARKTRETILLCEAAGFDKIIIETVGVGQSETLVHSMVDFFLLLKLAGAGDELQGIKRGIIEMADLIVINKAEGNNLPAAKLAKKQFETALHFYPPKANKWTPKVLLASALHNTGIDKVAGEIQNFVELTRGNGFFNHHRTKQNQYWLYESIDTQLKNRFYNHQKVKDLLPELLKQIETHQITPFEAAEILLQLKV